MTQPAPHSPAPLTPERIARIQASFRVVAPIAGAAADLFYTQLFARDPGLRALFPADLAEQKKKLMQVLAMGVGALGDLDRLVPVLEDLGARHSGYGVRAEHYPTVGAALLETLAIAFGEDWTEELAADWAAAYGAMSGAMLEGAAKARRAAA